MNRALESILLSVLSALEAEMVFIRNLVGGLLAELEDDIDHDRFKRLLHYSRRLASFQNRAKLVSRHGPSIFNWREVVLSSMITELRDIGDYGAQSRTLATDRQWLGDLYRTLTSAPWRTLAGAQGVCGTPVPCRDSRLTGEVN